MDITEVSIKLANEPHDVEREKLRGFASVVLDSAIVIHDIKIIEGSKGFFVAMPSRKLTDRCDCCGFKNHLRACHCNQCGHGLNPNRAPRGEDGRARLHADITHPINTPFRVMLEDAVLQAWHFERTQASEEIRHASAYPA